MPGVLHRNNDFQIFLNYLVWFGTLIGFVVAIVTSGLIIFRDKQSKPGLSVPYWDNRVYATAG